MVDAFNEISYENDKPYYNPETSCENVVEWIRGSRTATVFFSQKRYISKIRALAKKFPDDVQIVHENVDGSIVAHIPINAVHFNIRRRDVSDEEREKMKQRLEVARSVRFGNKSAEDSDGDIEDMNDDDFDDDMDDDIGDDETND